MPRINIIINAKDNYTKIISIIRKNTQMSISEIKEKIDKNKYVLSCDHFDTEKLKELSILIDKLIDAKASIKIFQDDRPIELGHLYNLIKSYEGISNERELLDYFVLNG